MKTSVRKWNTRFLNNEFESNDFKTQVDGGWYEYEVWGRKNNFDACIIGFNNSRDLVKWLNAPWKE